MEETIEGYLAIAKELKSFMPEVVDVVLEYESESKKVIEALVDTVCEMKLRAIAKYTDKGLTKDQAILLVMDNSHTIAEQLRRSSVKTTEK